MFLVYARAFGGPRRPLAHFVGLKAAQRYAENMNRVLVDDDLTIVEQPDGGRKNFVDSPDTPVADGGAGLDDSIPVETIPAQGGKK